MSSLQPEALTWTGLLAQWVQFAQASLALPADAESERWRSSVPAIINLQAVMFALADLDRLEADEHCLALDKAELVIRAAESSLAQVWKHAPASVSEILIDAHAALRARRALSANEKPRLEEPGS
jgi:hypothetical protein